MANIYDFTLTDGKGNPVSLANFKGKVMLIVNTATGCGFTPHYKPIEQMYSDFHDKGFEVIDIPCNQFKGQTPGTDDEIHEFCTLNYGTEFPQMKKSDVNGPDELPLYTYLKSAALHLPEIAEGFRRFRLWRKGRRHGAFAQEHRQGLQE